MISHLDKSSLRNVGLVLTQGFHPFWISSSRTEQSDSRLGIQSGTDISRVETRGGGIPQDLLTSGPMRNRPFCHTTERSAGKVHQLETGSRSHVNRCLPNQLEGTEGVCIPTIFPNWQVFTESQSRKSSIVMVAPVWQNQTWFPMLLELAVELPLLIPHCNNLLVDP